MIIDRKLGNLRDIPLAGRMLDTVPLEWFETNKRILHKRSRAGREIQMRFLAEGPALMQDDVIHADETSLLVIDIIACDVIIVRPVSMYEMASLCYEIGNKHLPLFLENDEVLVPYEAPLARSLAAAGFDALRDKRKLLYPLRTTVSPHAHRSGESLFSKILQLTSPLPGEK